ncbi:vexin isoform X2 [Equus quagga]|uniref:vexin isoform X2 n=1 Tax=Equus quagga TaxID=89248 RepID=UPI001EE36D34|nr:vexin isoform X2 [Equus quagga]
MHQIYSCSDENIEVFTTVIPSKVSSPARRRVKSSQHLLTKNVVIESDLHTPRALELLPHRSDRRDAEGRRSGRLQTARPPGAQPAKTPARPVGISEPKSANLCGSRAYGKSLIPPVARISVKAPTVLEVAATGPENGAVLTRGSCLPAAKYSTGLLPTFPTSRTSPQMKCTKYAGPETTGPARMLQPRGGKLAPAHPASAGLWPFCSEAGSGRGCPQDYRLKNC